MILSPDVFAVPRPQRALFKNIPMPLLNKVRNELKRKGIEFRIRYRGPRATALYDFRYPSQQAAECLKENANRFSVYSK